MNAKLDGNVALVAGATRGAGRAIAIELSKLGTYVYATGRSSNFSGPSDIHRQETIDETEWFGPLSMDQMCLWQEPVFPQSQSGFLFRDKQLHDFQRNLWHITANSGHFACHLRF